MVVASVETTINAQRVVLDKKGTLICFIGTSTSVCYEVVDGI